MFENSLFAIVDRKADEVANDPEQDNAKGVFKAAGYGALYGFLEVCTFIGAITIIGGTAVMLTGKTKKK